MSEIVTLVNPNMRAKNEFTSNYNTMHTTTPIQAKSKGTYVDIYLHAPSLDDQLDIVMDPS